MVDDAPFNLLGLKQLLHNIISEDLIIEQAYNGKEAVDKILNCNNLTSQL